MTGNVLYAAGIVGTRLLNVLKEIDPLIHVFLVTNYYRYNNISYMFLHVSVEGA